MEIFQVTYQKENSEGKKTFSDLFIKKETAIEAAKRFIQKEARNKEEIEIALLRLKQNYFKSGYYTNAAFWNANYDCLISIEKREVIE